MISPRQPNSILSKLLKSPANKIHQCRKLYVPNLNSKRKLPKNHSTELLLSDRKVKRKERTVKTPRQNFSKFQNHRTFNAGSKGYKSYRSLKNDDDQISNLIQRNNQKNNSKIDKSSHCRVIVTDCNQDIEHYIAITDNNDTTKELTLNFVKNQTKGTKNKIVQYLDKLYPNVYYKSQPTNISLDFILLQNKISNDFLKGKTLRLKTQRKIEIIKEDVSLKHFQIIKLIGSGGFSKVFLCRFKQDGNFYALKLIDKDVIVKNKKKRIIMNERNIMEQSAHPFIIDMKFAFETEKYLAFVLEYCPGGELFGLVKKYKIIPEKTARFYIIEILLGLGYLHENHIVYRDIKPQNILLTVEGHVKIADLGLAKPNMDRQIAYSFCGSPEYMSPQMILQVGHSYPVDYYCMGALLYQLLTGLPPFYSRDPNQIYEAVLSEQVFFPDDIALSSDCKSLLRGLLCKDYKKRLGSLHGIKQILSHPWFGKNSYTKYIEKEISPPTDFLEYQKLYLDNETTESAEMQLRAVLNEQKRQKYLKQPIKQVMKNFYYDYRSKNANRASFQLNSQRSNGSNKQNSLKHARSNSGKKNWKKLTVIPSNNNKISQNSGKVGKRMINQTTSRL